MKQQTHQAKTTHAFAALFDMDGLMVDTEGIHSRAYEIVMQRRYNLKPTLTEHGTVHTPGETTVTTWKRLMHAHNFSGDLDILAADKRDTMIEVLAEGVEALPGLHKLFNTLRAENIPIAVATSAQRERAELILKKLGVENDVAALITANDINDVKPAPDAYLAAAQKLGFAPEQCVVFEDAEVGVTAGKLAGAKVIAVPSEYTKRMDFSQADLVVHSLADITYAKILALFE